jgi:hypothetical protein
MINDLVTILEPGNMAKCGCYPPCNDIVYDVGYSLSYLPEPTGEHNDFYSKINDFLQNDLPEPKRQLYQKLNTTSNRLISRLNVFIADSNIIKTTESPDYELIRLVSDIGGQLGLWIGISIITLVEVVQLAGDILRKLADSGIRGVQSTTDDDNATNRNDHGSQRTKYHKAAEDSDDARHWPSSRRLQAENGSASSLPVDEMTSSV